MTDAATARQWKRLVAATRQSPFFRPYMPFMGGFEVWDADGGRIAGRPRTALTVVALAVIVGVAGVLIWALPKGAPELMAPSLLLLAGAAVVALAPYTKTVHVRSGDGLVVVRWGLRPFARLVAVPLDRISITVAIEDEVAGYRGYAVVLLECEGLEGAVRLLRSMSSKSSEKACQKLERLFAVDMEPPVGEHTLPDGTVVPIPVELLHRWPGRKTRIRFREDGSAVVDLTLSSRLAPVFWCVTGVLYAAATCAWLAPKWMVVVRRLDSVVNMIGRLAVVQLLILCWLTAILLATASAYVWLGYRALHVLTRKGRKRIVFNQVQRAVLMELPEQAGSPTELPFDEVVCVQLCLADRREPDPKNKGHFRRWGQVNLVCGREPVRRLNLLTVRKVDEATDIARKLAELLGCPVCRSGPEEGAPMGRAEPRKGSE